MKSQARSTRWPPPSPPLLLFTTSICPFSSQMAALRIRQQRVLFAVLMQRDTSVFLLQAGTQLSCNWEHLISLGSVLSKTSGERQKEADTSICLFMKTAFFVCTHLKLLVWWFQTRPCQIPCPGFWTWWSLSCKHFPLECTNNLQRKTNLNEGCPELPGISGYSLEVTGSSESSPNAISTTTLFLIQVSHPQRQSLFWTPAPPCLDRTGKRLLSPSIQRSSPFSNPLPPSSASIPPQGIENSQHLHQIQAFSV